MYRKLTWGLAGGAAVLLIGFLAWSGNKISDLNGSVGQLEGRVGGVEKQVSDVAASLKDVSAELKGLGDSLHEIDKSLLEVKIRVSSIQLTRDVKAALVTTKAFEETPGNWASFVYIVDPKSPEAQQFKVVLKEQRDPEFMAKVMGIAMQADSPVSFESLQAIDGAAKSPDFAWTKCSFVLHKNPDGKLGELTTAILGAQPVQVRVGKTFGDWKSLAEALEEESAVLAPKKQ